MPVTEYIAVTKEICDRLGENTDGVDCSEYYQKAKDLLQDYKDKCASHPNISKMKREAIKTLKEDNTHVVLTADKGVAMVVMDKSSYVDKCMALLQDTNVYQPCRDLTGQIHRQVQATLHKLKGKHGKDHCYIVGLGLNCKFIHLLFKCSVLKFIKISSFIVFIGSEIIYSQTDTLTLELMELR